MIHIQNKVKKLRENRNELLDANTIINEQIDNVIKEITQKLKRLGSEHEAEVIITGTSEKMNFSINSESDKTVSKIEKILNE